MGRNTLGIFVLSSILAPVLDISIFNSTTREMLFKNLFFWIEPMLGSFLFALAQVIVWVIVARMLQKKGIFFRVSRTTGDRSLRSLKTSGMTVIVWFLSTLENPPYCGLRQQNHRSYQTGGFSMFECADWDCLSEAKAADKLCLACTSNPSLSLKTKSTKCIIVTNAPTGIRTQTITLLQTIWKGEVLPLYYRRVNISRE